MRRLVLVLADGLRPDAISPSVMPSLDALGGVFTLALHARTVRPSATVAALASLATGVGPAAHRLIEPGLGFLPRLRSIRPVAQMLAAAGVPTDIVTAELGPACLPVAWALAATAGVRRLTAKGSRARDTAAAAERLLSQHEERLLFLYLPDCDRAGHAHGWMSPEYLEAAAEVDAALGLLSPWLADAVFIITADHGGGGVYANEHDEPHPVNDHIPLVLAGRGVTRRHQLTRPLSLLDIPPTVLWWFGVPVPDNYEGRPLAEGFTNVSRATPVPA
ncbi:MAG TPA: alkaline phosphatase family protein [Gemmatimonadales bacterium]|nr:alkaline phosphatase family protein [Gemmatimonadales bacterium]